MKPYLRDKTTFEPDEYAGNTAFEAGYLVAKNAGWRSLRPIVNTDKCVGCLQCYLYCPDGTIYEDSDKVAVDYDFCKGCGICEKVCKFDAIVMKEEKE